VAQRRFSAPRGRHNSDDDDIPGVGKVLSYAIPAIGVWIMIPLLSMIDTSSVGLLSGTAEQAALNPAIGILNYSARLLVSLRRY